MAPKPTLRNVTNSDDPDEFSRKIFPCPLCGNGLAVNLTFKGKPYCTCNDCGLQLFFRGKHGIERLRAVLKGAKFVSGDQALASDPLALVNQLEKLKNQKTDLEEKQGIIFENRAISNAIAAVNIEIAAIEKALAKLADNHQEKRK